MGASYSECRWALATLTCTKEPCRSLLGPRNFKPLPLGVTVMVDLMKLSSRPVPNSDLGGGRLTWNVDQWWQARWTGGLPPPKFWNKYSISSLKKWTFVELGGGGRTTGPTSPPGTGLSSLAILSHSHDGYGAGNFQQAYSYIHGWPSSIFDSGPRA